MTEEATIEITQDDFMALLGCLGMMAALIGAVYIEGSEEEQGMMFVNDILCNLIAKYGTEEDRISLQTAFERATLDAAPIPDAPN